MSPSELAPYLSVIFALCVSVGALLAIRQSYTKRVSEIQTSVISAQKIQNEMQEKQIAALRLEVERLHEVVTTLRYTLKRRGISIEVNGEFITITEEQPQQQRKTQVRIIGKDNTDKDVSNDNEDDAPSDNS